MKTTVKIFGLCNSVTFDDENIFPFTTSSGDDYEKAVIAESGELIGWEESVGAWVQLAGDADSVRGNGICYE